MKNFNIISSQPVTIATSVTGLGAVIDVIIRAITFLIRYDYDNKNNFENILKEKLEKAYSPLIILISKYSNEIMIVENY